MRRTSSIASCTSVGVSPAIASSSSSTLGSEASARAISSRLRPGVPRLRAGASITGPRPTRCSTSRALARASRALGWRSSAPIMALSSTDIDSKVSGTWKVRASPSRARSSGGWRVTSCAGEGDGARGHRQIAGQAVEEGRLARAVGADQAEDVALLDRHRGVVDRLEGAERLDDVLRLNQHGVDLAAIEQRQQAARQEAGDDHDDRAIDHEGEAGALAAEIGCSTAPRAAPGSARRPAGRTAGPRRRAPPSPPS